MAQVIVTESSLQNIGTAIRSKLGTLDTYKPSEMAGAISLIHGDPVLETLTANANDTYNPSSGKDGFSQVVVNVPNSYTSGDEGKVVSGGALVAQSSQSITQNGTYDTTLKNQAIVNVPNSYSTSDEGKVVDNGALVAQGSQTITQNGTYDTTLKNQVTVNVSGGGGGSKNILGGTTNPTSADGTDGDIYIKYKDYSGVVFPSGYTPIEYIESSSNGGQYIDTNYSPNANSEIYFRGFIYTSGNSGNRAVWGTTSPSHWIISHINGSPNLTYAWGGTDSRLGGNITGQIVKVTAKKGDVTALADDGTLIQHNTPSAGNNTGSGKILIFRGEGTNSSTYLRLYRFEVHENGTAIRIMQPAKRNSDDVLGLYDLVNDVFYTNSGTESFIGGEEMTGKPIDAVYLKVSGAWIPLEDGDWDDVNTGE